MDISNVGYEDGQLEGRESEHLPSKSSRFSTTDSSIGAPYPDAELKGQWKVSLKATGKNLRPPRQLLFSRAESSDGAPYPANFFSLYLQGRT
jgi:hypothetical protein